MQYKFELDNISNFRRLIIDEIYLLLDKLNDDGVTPIKEIKKYLDDGDFHRLDIELQYFITNSEDPILKKYHDIYSSYIFLYVELKETLRN